MARPFIGLTVLGAFFGAGLLTSCGSSSVGEPGAERLIRDVRWTTVSLEMESEDFETVLAELRSQTGLAIHVTPEALARIEGPVGALNLSDISLEVPLNMLQAVSEDISWLCHEGGVLFDLRSNHPELAGLRVQIFALVELTSGLTGGGRPVIALEHEAEVADEENPLFGAEDEGLVDPAEVDAFVEHLRSTIGSPGTWESPAFLRKQGEQTLVARNRPDVLAQVARAVEAWIAEREEDEAR